MDVRDVQLNEADAKAEERIQEMEAEGYEFPEPFSRADWTLAGIVILAMAVWIIAGIWM